MKKMLLPLLLLFPSFFVIAQPLISFDTVVTGLSQPVDAVEVNDGSNRFFIVERTGKIRIWKNLQLLPSPFLDVSSLITTANGEQGLLSLAFHPDYKNNGYFFIYYTNTSGAITVARYRRTNDSIANPSSGVILMTIPKRFPNHNGGNLDFGRDGYLYFGTGDGGAGGDPDRNAQNGQSLLGKMLRIDVNNPNPPYYNIPPSNPFAGSSTTKGEIIATGLRNPWRWSFDKLTGDMWIADVGQNAWEEVNVVAAANIFNRDYGWSCFEGTHAFNGCAAKPNNVFPVFEYDRNTSTGGISVTGGFVYRGAEFPSLQGYYICTDFGTANGWLIKQDQNGSWKSTLQTKWPGGMSSFAESANGDLYAMTLSGTIYKVIASSPLPVQLVSFAGRETGNQFELYWKVQNEAAGDIYIIEKRTGPNESFSEINKTVVLNSRSFNSYAVKVSAPTSQSFYRLKTISADGKVSYSEIISFKNKAGVSIKAIVTGTNLRITVPNNTTLIELFDAAGRALKKQKVNAGERQIMIPLDNFSKGIISIKTTINHQTHSIQVLY